jgi:hypothetical protein
MTASSDLVERSGDLKREVLDFAGLSQFRRAYIDAFEEYFEGRTREQSDLTNFLDYFILQWRLKDGSTIVEQFVNRHLKLPVDERQMLLGWRDVVEGIFEVKEQRGEALIVLNLVDELTYRVRSNMGPSIFKQTPPGSFIIGRLVPVEDEWLVSGAIRLLPKSSRRDVYATAVQVRMAKPSLVFRNQERLEQAREMQRQEVRSFEQFFGSKVVVIPGRELRARMDEYWHFRTHEFRLEDGQTAAEKVRQEGREVPQIRESDLPPQLMEAETVGVVYDEVDGMNYFPEFGLVEEAFASPELIAKPRYREAVQNYLRSPGIIPLPLRLLAERDPEKASRLFQKLLKKPRFSWERDGEKLLRRYKPEYYAKPVLPSVIPVSGEFSLASVAR